MQVTFYINSSDKRKINKSLSTLGAIACQIKEGTSMLSPTIQILKNSLPTISANYMYIDTFNRYYHITDITADIGSIIEISGKVDVLQSNANAIRNISCLVLRQEKLNNRYYQDNELAIRTTKTYVYKKIGDMPNNTTYLLTVDGGSKK